MSKGMGCNPTMSNEELLSVSNLCVLDHCGCQDTEGATGAEIVAN